MTEPLIDARIGTKARDGAPRQWPQTDVLGKPLGDIDAQANVPGITQGVGHGHFVVVPSATEKRLTEAAIADVKQLVDAHYAPAAAEPVVIAEAPVMVSDGPEAVEQSAKKKRGEA